MEVGIRRTFSYPVIDKHWQSNENYRFEYIELSRRFHHASQASYYFNVGAGCCGRCGKQTAVDVSCRGSSLTHLTIGESNTSICDRLGRGTTLTSSTTQERRSVTSRRI